MITLTKINKIVDTLTDIHTVLSLMNVEISKLAQEIIKLNERIEDATTHSSRRGEA